MQRQAVPEKGKDRKGEGERGAPADPRFPFAVPPLIHEAYLRDRDAEVRMESLKVMEAIWGKAGNAPREAGVRARVRSFLAGAARCDESESVRDSAAGLLRELPEEEKGA